MKDNSKKKTKDNEQVNKVENLVKNKTYESHQALINDFLRRINKNELTKVFCFNSQDEHIRRFLLRHNWIENSQFTSSIYDLKWSYIENNEEINSMIEGQFYNHFRNTRELTSKSGLLANFKNNQEYGLDPFDFFPRAYDLGNQAEREDFILEYEKTTYFIVLKKHIKYFKLRKTQLVKNLKEQIINENALKQINQENKVKRFQFTREIYRKKNKIYPHLKYVAQNQEKEFLVNVPLLCQALCKYREWKYQIQSFIEDNPNQEQTKLMNTKLRTCIFNYSQCQQAYDKLEKQEVQNTLLYNNDKYQTPNQALIKKLLSLHLFYKKNDYSYRIDGIENLWIIKPSSNSRGQGIYLEKNIQDAIESGNKLQARLIQKYIEKPLILHPTEKSFQKTVSGKKFDLRQWVLVKSFVPLKIFMYSVCYMRMCSQNFELKDYKNPYKHLTNYSLNKNQFDQACESVYSSEILEDLLIKYTNINWEKDIKPKINDIIIQTLKTLQSQFENENKNCFELFGFDIMIDKKFKPWLLEVNLSPACSERSSWLTKALNYMTEGLFRIILPKEYFEESAFLQKSDQYYWEPIFQEEEDLLSSQKVNQEVFLTVQGTSINLKKEKKQEKKYIELLATLCIQKFFRMFLAKRELTRLKQTKCAIIFQRYGRMYLAINQRKKLKKMRCAIVIQSMIRIYQAKKKKIFLNKQKSAILIQKNYRTQLAKKIKLFLRREKSSLILQSAIRVMISQKIYLNNRKRFQSIIKLQQCWMKVFQKRQHQSIDIQKYVRGFLQRKRYAFLLKQIKCATYLQKFYRKRISKKILHYLKIEASSLVIQTYIKSYLQKVQLKNQKQKEGLDKIHKIFTVFRLRESKFQIEDKAHLRNQAAYKIQGLKHIRTAIRYAKRLKRLKLLIKLQSKIKAYIYRKRYLKTIKRKKMISKIIKAMRRYLYKKKLEKRIQYKQRQRQKTFQQIDANKRDKSIRNQSYTSLQSQASKASNIQQFNISKTKVIKDIRNSSQKKMNVLVDQDYEHQQMQQKSNIRIKLNPQDQDKILNFLNQDINEYYKSDSAKSFKIRRSFTKK